MESFGDSKETNLYAFDKTSFSQIRYRIVAEVDEDKLTTKILLTVDDVKHTVLEGEDLCIDFYYGTHVAPVVVDSLRAWSYQLLWCKGSDSELTYD